MRACGRLRTTLESSSQAIRSVGFLSIILSIIQKEDRGRKHKMSDRLDAVQSLIVGLPKL